MAQKKKLSEKIDKRYRGRVRIGEDAKGKPVYKYISGKTKAELENNRKRVKEYYASGAGERKDMLFEDFAEMWIESKVTKVKPTTATGLRSTLKKHLLPGFSGRRLKAINSLDIQMFIDAYEGVRKGTLDDVIYCLRQLFRYAKVHRYITENPTIDIERPKTTAKKIRALDPKYYEDVERIAREHEEGLLIGILFYPRSTPLTHEKSRKPFLQKDYQPHCLGTCSA